MGRSQSIAPWITPLAFIATAVAVLTIGPSLRRDAEINRDVSQMARAIQDHYLEEVDPDEVRYRALEGMVDSLDPYSEFYRPDVAKEILEENEGKFGGVGIHIGPGTGESVIILSTIEGGPAFQAGLRAGDWIVAVDGTPVRWGGPVARLIKGEVETPVVLSIRREGKEDAFDVTVIRGEIEIESVVGAEIIDEEKRIGYVRVIQFQENTPAEFDEAVERLAREGMESLILDVRSNPGGILNSALHVAGRFLPDGALIVRTVGRDRDDDVDYRVDVESTLPTMPVVVLTNEMSASASEIVAGALQDHRRGLLVGARTFGKASVQSLIHIGDDTSLLKLTTSKYQTPKGRSIHRDQGEAEEGDWGLMPDVVAALDLEDFQAIRLAWTRREVPASVEGDTAPPPPDTQLDEALRILRDLAIYRAIRDGVTDEESEAPAKTAKGAR